LEEKGNALKNYMLIGIVTENKEKKFYFLSKRDIDNLHKKKYDLRERVHRIEVSSVDTESKF
jgi:Holliday junction resolvase RusA-like endonuclease